MSAVHTTSSRSRLSLLASKSRSLTVRAVPRSKTSWSLLRSRWAFATTFTLALRTVMFAQCGDGGTVVPYRRCAVISLYVGVRERMCHRYLSLPGRLLVCHVSFFRISLSDLCRRLLARSITATNFIWFENGYYESSIRGAA